MAGFRLRRARKNAEKIVDSKCAKAPRHKSIYLLPNAFTTAALFSGFFAIVQAMHGRFDVAAIAIFVAMVLDGMDGRVARLTNTQSAFGEQYDSLADMVSFGVAPALVVYQAFLSPLGKWGWVAAFVYCAGAALRLARFNANIAVVDKRYFQGLPSPAAAALVAGFVWLIVEEKLLLSSPQVKAWMAWVVTFYAGLTMVSSVPFWSGKTLDIRHSVPFWVIIVFVIILVVISTNPPLMLFGIFVVFSLHGYVLWLMRWRKLRLQHEKEKV